jgi:DNA-binding MarR family transcriptional regulator
MATLRVMIDIADSTVENVIGQLTLTQFRALRTVAKRTPVTMSRVAAELDINPSSVTRACDKLEALNLVQRAQNPLNKRETLLAPSAKGRRIVERVDHARRAELSAILRRTEPMAQANVAAAFELFVTAAVGVDGPIDASFE